MPLTTQYSFLEPLQFSSYPNRRLQHLKALKHPLRQSLDVPVAEDLLGLQKYLETREQLFIEVVSTYFQEEWQALVQKNLKTSHSFEILWEHTHLMDALIEVSFQFALNDLPVLLLVRQQEIRKDLEYKQRVLPQKQQKLESSQHHTSEEYLNDQEYEYYQGVHETLQQEILELQASIDQQQKQFKRLRKYKIQRKSILKALCVFARGGYGRGEMSFSSDCDLGYCLDTSELHPGEVELFRDFIVRIELLLNRSGIQTSHQYFELHEDLSRFAKPETLHTVAAVLESRQLLGSHDVFLQIRQRFYEVLPYEVFVKKKRQEYEQSPQPELSEMDLKQDAGGLRSIQIPLWLASATFGVFPGQTADILGMLIQKNLLTLTEAYYLAQAMEFLYELRNFTGVASHYIDAEVQAHGVEPSRIHDNQLNDLVEKLYLMKKQRFASVDDFDRYRLHLLRRTQTISQHLLKKLLDRKVVHSGANFQVVTHIHENRVIEVLATRGLPQMPLERILHSPEVILEFFLYLANTPYELSVDLKTELGSILTAIPVGSTFSSEIAHQFTELLLSSGAAKVFTWMFEIEALSNNSYLADTLLGRFIPEANQMRFLLRNLNYHQHPVCEHTLLAMNRAQEELDLLKQSYPELYQYLHPKHLLALKWGVFFHDIGKVAPETRHEISGTSMAVRALKRLGYEDDELFKLVSLLIVHHMTVVRLSKTSTYFDKAIQSIIKIAEQDLIQALLLFLVNISDYASVSDQTAQQLEPLREFFDQTFQVFLEFQLYTKVKDPMGFIQHYLRNKKQELLEETRIELLVLHSLQQDLDTVLFEPMQSIHLEESQSLSNVKADLQSCWRYLKVGSLDSSGIQKYTEQLSQMIRSHVSESSLHALTHSFDASLNWFFEALPNRFLLGQPAGVLSQKVLEFSDWNNALMVSLVSNARGRITDVLIYAHDQPGLHRRVAYALAQKNLGVTAGKVNSVFLKNGTVGYCYYFQVSNQGDVIFPRDLERTLMDDILPDLESYPTTSSPDNTLKIKFLENDRRSYVIVQKEDGTFERQDRDYEVVQLVSEDEELLYYKMVHAFEHFHVPIQQSLITTTGQQVLDYFYVTPQDAKRLRNSKFHEYLQRT